MESTGLWNIVGRRVKLLLSIKTQSDLFSIFLFLFFLTQFWYCIDVMMSTRLELAAKAGSMLDRKSVCSNYNYSNYRCPCKIFTIEKWDTFVPRFYFTTVLLIFFFFVFDTHKTNELSSWPGGRKVIFLLQNFKRNTLPQQYVSNIIFNIMHFYPDVFFFFFPRD